MWRKFGEIPFFGFSVVEAQKLVKWLAFTLQVVVVAINPLKCKDVNWLHFAIQV